MNRLVIVVEGGLVQEIFSAEKDTEVIVCDYDTEGMDEGELMETPAGDMGSHGYRSVSYDPGLVEAWFSRWSKSLLEVR